MRVNRFTFYLPLALLLLALAFLMGMREKLAPEQTRFQPNFILIYTDDQRFDALGRAGKPFVHTPVMDSLSRSGAYFTHAFVTLSICSPSRAALLTGRYGSANGVLKLDQGIRPTEKTFAQYLKEVGYQTAVIGKWHLANTPGQLGFDYSRYFVANGPYYNRKVFENGKEAVAKGFIEDYSAGQAAEYLQKAQRSGQPFVLYFCTQVPHMNPQFDWDVQAATLRRYPREKMPLPGNWQDELTGKPPYLKQGRSRQKALQYGYNHPDSIRKHQQRYYAAVTDMDTALGKMLHAVKQLGLDKNTYILLMGDNGWFLGEHGFTSKVLPYETSIRVPLLVSGPGVKPQRNSQLVLNIDVLPTLLELAGVPIPDNAHGKSLLPLLKGQSAAWRTSFLYEAPEPELGTWPLYAVRNHQWKYIQTYDSLDRKKLAFEELYDLKKDPLELVNLANRPAHTQRKKEMTADLKKLMEPIQ